jgi:TrmH family RNA methyltransferase
VLTGEERDGAESVPSTGAPDLDEFRALLRRDHRDRAGRYVVEGARFVYAALRARAEIEGALVCPEASTKSARDAAEAVRRRGVPIREVSRAEFESTSNADEPSGVALIVRQRWTAPRRPTKGEAPVWIAVGRIRSAGNLGTILRTALAAGAAGALFLDPETDPFDPAAVRASMGAILELPLAQMTTAHLSAWKHRAGALVVGTSAEAPRDFRDMPRRRPTVLMLGCERRGMSRAQRRVCDVTVSIPMAAGVDSLNVGVAAGILLFAVRRT